MKTKIPGLILLQPDVRPDPRGHLMESYNRKTLHDLGYDLEMVQDNQVWSREAGTLRGLHYQLHPMAQTKLLRVLRGSIFDVSVDLRHGSPTYGKHLGVTLTAESRQQLLVPRGFAHGYVTLEADTEVFYKVDNAYSPEHERGILWNDPELSIDWPVSQPVMVERDRRLPSFRKAEHDYEF